MEKSCGTDYFDYDLYNAYRDGNIFERVFHSLRLREVESIANLEQKKVLDYGCGSGLVLIHLLKKGYDVSGYDISKPNIDLCNKYCKENGFNPDLYLRELPSQKWDAVLLNNVLEYVNEKKAVLLDVLEHLNKNGLIIVSIALRSHPFIKFNNIRSLFSGRDKKDIVTAEPNEKLDERELLTLFHSINFYLVKTKLGAFLINKHYMFRFSN